MSQDTERFFRETIEPWMRGMLDLTSCRNFANFVCEFQQIVAFLLPGSEAELFAIRRLDNGDLLREVPSAMDIDNYALMSICRSSKCPPLPVWALQLLIDGEDSQPSNLPASESTMGTHIAVPIKDRSIGFQLLEIRAPTALDYQPRLLHYLVRSYRNRYRLLHENMHDALTGLLNRKAYDDKIEHFVLSCNNPNRRKHNQREHCLTLVDIDHFKRVNDTYGHLFGDEVLIQLAGLMKSSFRHTDFLFRYGGEEFAAILTDISIDETRQVLERFRQKVARHAFPQVGQVTVSIGYTAIRVGCSQDILFDQADRALYHAKEHGRNQSYCYDALRLEGKLDDSGQVPHDIKFF